MRLVSQIEKVLYIRLGVLPNPIVFYFDDLSKNQIFTSDSVLYIYILSRSRKEYDVFISVECPGAPNLG